MAVRSFFIALSGLAFCAGSVSVLSAEDDFFSAVEVDIDPQAVAGKNDDFSYRGYLQALVKTGLDTPDSNYPFERDSAGLSRSRTDGFLELRGNLNDNLSWQFSAKMEADWYRWDAGETNWELYRQRSRLKDAYLDASFANDIWLRAGHQVLAWGDSEGLSITDILSPVDSRAPGQAELQDLREQIPAVMLAFPLGGTLTTVITYDAGHDRYAEEDEEFYPYIALSGGGIAVENKDPNSRWEYAMKWEKRFNGGDFAVVAGDVNDNELSVQEIAAVQGVPRVTFGQERVKVLGASGNRVMGSWLFRTEVAHYWDKPVEYSAQYAWGNQDQWRGMLSVEYSGVDDLTLSYETNSIYAVDEPSSPPAVTAESKAWQFGHVFRLRHTAYNERLTNTLWALALTTDEMQVFRWDMGYDLSDTWELATAVVLYSNDNSASTLYPYRNHDTMNVTVTYNF